MLQTVEAGSPEDFIEGEPVLRGPQASGIEPHHTAASAALAADERGPLQNVEVLGYRGERHGVGLGDLADCLLAARDVAEDGTTGRVGEGVEDGVKSSRR